MARITGAALSRRNCPRWLSSDCRGAHECTCRPFAAVDLARDLPDCPTCGLRIEPAGPVAGGTRCIDDPGLVVPSERLIALADEAGIDVRTVQHERRRLYGAAVALTRLPEDELDRCVLLADDLVENLRADILAFAIAVACADTDLILASPDQTIGIGRGRLPPAEGAGHLAWHMLRGCGRGAPSTTFAVKQIRRPQLHQKKANQR